MKTTSFIIGTTNDWSESKMIKEYKNNPMQFGSGIGSYPMKAKVTITIEKLKNY